MAERVHVIEQGVTSASAAIARVADYMSCYANRRRRDLAIDVESFAWLSMESLSLQPRLTRKLAAKFTSLFKIIE